MIEEGKEIAGVSCRCKYCKKLLRVRELISEYDSEKETMFDFVCKNCYPTVLEQRKTTCDYRDYNGFYIHIHKPICEEKIRKNVLQPINT